MLMCYWAGTGGRMPFDRHISFVSFQCDEKVFKRSFTVKTVTDKIWSTESMQHFKNNGEYDFVSPPLLV